MKTKRTVRAKKASSSKGSLQAFIEKRRSLRTPLFVLEVKWKKLNKVFIGETRNISIGGMLMSTERALQVGEHFPVEFILPDRKTKIKCTGEVAWTHPYKEEGVGSEGVGVRFVDLDDKKMENIGKWIEKQEMMARKKG